LTSNNDTYWSQWLQGSLQHRAGKHNQALSLLKTSSEDKNHPPDGIAGTQMWMALAHHQSKQFEDARREFEQAEKWLANYPDAVPEAEKRRLGLHLHNWLEVHVLRQEATALLRPGPKKGR
jgi:hypothetical protein